MDSSQASISSTIEDPSMNRQTTEDGEKQPISDFKSPSGSLLSSLQNVEKESRGVKQKNDSEEEVLDDIGKIIAKKAKRPKQANKYLASMLKHATKTQEKMDDLDSSLEKSARKLQSLRNNHIKMIENFLLWVDNEASEGSNAEISEASDLIERFEENLAALRDLYDL